MNAEAVPTAKFRLGRIVTTPQALETIPNRDILAGITRHQSGDWGDVCKDDRKENDLSLEKGFRLLSVYRARNGIVFWIVTEADRSVTTVLLPEEY